MISYTPMHTRSCGLESQQHCVCCEALTCIIFVQAARVHTRGLGCTISCVASTSAPQAPSSSGAKCPFAPRQFQHDKFDYAPFRQPNYQVLIIRTYLLSIAFM
jgi:hypothetical protein